MKKVNKIVIPAAVLSAIGAAVFFTTSFASATTGEQTNLVDKLASKFNLNKTEVQAVVDEFHNEREVSRQQAMSTRLQSLVDSGKITAEQKTKIEAKMKELEATREANRNSNLTEEQRHAKMEAERTALQKWATDNNIDLSLIMPGKGMGMGMGRGGHGAF